MEEKLKLLVVDDEPDNLDLLYRTFRRNFRVFKAKSGAEALEVLAQQGEMAIIISDQRMPKMTGTEFLSHTVEKFPDTIRMVLTGYTDVEDLVSAINSGKVFKYITKPWNPKKLKDVILQAAETYTALKKRTRALGRALSQESVSNNIMAAVRGSLDYDNTLKTVVNVLGQAFETDFETLSAAPSDTTMTTGVVELEGKQFTRIVVPFLDQDKLVATVCLYRETLDKQWCTSTIDLLENVSDQVALAILHARLYQQLQMQSFKMRAELEVARKIQSNLLHQSWPETPGLKIQARCQPAREVGGDFFEVFMHPQGDIWLAVGDVSGKGVPAALFMASAISVLRRELAQEKSPDPEKVMSNLNHSLSNDLMSNNCFITMALIRYSEATGQLVYANAGHVYPVVWSHKNIVAQRQEDPSNHGALEDVQPTYLDVRGVPLGILPE